MRICIPTESKEGGNAIVYGHFGSAPYFTIYDTENTHAEVVENSNQNHAHGMCQPMGALVGKKIDVVVCGGMGARAVQRLNESGIKACRAVPGSVAYLADQFVKGGLEEITVNNACAAHSCH